MDFFNQSNFVRLSRSFAITVIVFATLLSCSYKNIDNSTKLVKNSFQANEVPDGYLAEISRKIMEYGGNVFDATIASLLLSYRLSPQDAGSGSFGQCLIYDYHNKTTEKLKFKYDTIKPSHKLGEDFITGEQGTLGNLLVYLQEKYSSLPWQELVDIAYQSISLESIGETAADINEDNLSKHKQDDLDIYDNLVYAELLKSFKLRYQNFQDSGLKNGVSPSFKAERIDNNIDLRLLLGFDRQKPSVYQTANFRFIFNDFNTSVYVENLLRIVEEFYQKGILESYSDNNQHFFINLFSSLLRFDRDYEKLLYRRVLTKEEISEIIDIDSREDFLFEEINKNSSKRELFSALTDKEKLSNIFSFSLVDINGNASNCQLRKPQEEIIDKKKYGMFQSFFDKASSGNNTNLENNNDILNSVAIIEYNNKGKRYFTGIIDAGADKYSANNLFYSLASMIYFNKDIFEVIRSRRFDITEGAFITENFDNFYGNINGIICPEGIPTVNNSIIICNAERDPRIGGIANVRTK